MVQGSEKYMETASQTAGPYVHIGCIPSFTGIDNVYSEDLGASPISDGAKGEIITITGKIYDGTGAPVLDAMLESWQADAAGIYPGQPGADPAVTGFCRFASDKDSGDFTLRTIKPGAIRDRSGEIMAPHITLWIAARGINMALNTRVYFEGEDNEGDPILTRVDPPSRVDTLIAKRTSDNSYRFDIRLQGDGETVFLDL